MIARSHGKDSASIFITRSLSILFITSYKLILSNLSQSIKLWEGAIDFREMQALYRFLDGLSDGKKFRKLVHIFLFQFHRWMHIAVQCDTDISMS